MYRGYVSATLYSNLRLSLLACLTWNGNLSHEIDESGQKNGDRSWQTGKKCRKNGPDVSAHRCHWSSPALFPFGQPITFLATFN
jgi:hypothetical protein